jgi:hypothetical protein
MPKGYWIASGQFLKGYRKADRKCPNTHCQPIGEEAELLIGYREKCVNFHPFSMNRCASVYNYYNTYRYKNKIT